MARRGDVDGFWRFWTGILDLVLRCVIDLRVEGVEHVPATGPALLAGNHVSSLDGIVLATVTARRAGRRARFLIAAETALRAGVLAGIYPEGGVNEFPDRGMRPLRSGASRLVAATGVPVLPVGVWGTQRRWPWAGPTFLRPWRPVVALAYGAPVSPVDRGGDVVTLQTISERIAAAIREQLDRARALAGADR
jgi:1-acyl-sn-glycerol-3-phosphate acyltransferase